MIFGLLVVLIGEKRNAATYDWSQRFLLGSMLWFSRNWPPVFKFTGYLWGLIANSGVAPD